ncbi:MAG: hypothetical protein KGS61_13495 [Verrucomicrobia bacterium]|nr:hypothetical protein [Verrucomicrobiota bacterium]
MTTPSANVTLPEGVSLRRVAQVLRDAWEVGSHQWTDTPLQLREGRRPAPPAPVPEDAMELFRLLAERRVGYLLVGGLAMLTYVQGRNTKDINLLLSLAALEKMPELEIRDRQDFFMRAQFRSVRVDLLLTTHPLFKTVEERFATKHRFAELEVPATTVEGLIVLKLFALPSLYRQLDWDRVYVYESDIKILLAQFKPRVQPLFELLEPHILASDLKELREIVVEAQQRIARAEHDAGE